MTIKAGVIGWPISHSLSPALHGHWLKAYGIDGSYEAIPVEPDDLERFVRALPTSSFKGINVTVPHKEQVAKLMDTLDPVAAKLGAVNLVTVESGKLNGQNTDGFGFLENVKAAGFKAKGANCLVLGAGGTTRAVVNALVTAGANVTIANRTGAKAEAIANELGGAVCPWADRSQVLESVDLLVNTTSLGMRGSPPLEIDLTKLSTTAMVTDCVYAPLETGLLAAARAKGCVGVDGLGMLIHQARPAFETWFGVAPEVTDELREVLIARQKEMQS